METFINFTLWLLALCGLGALSYIAAYFYARYEHHRKMLRFQQSQTYGH